MNQQFNQQYDEVIDTIQQRAIWRIGEKVTELQQFRCRCTKCGYESRHQRFDIARHRLLFGRSIRQIEDPRPMVRCERCGQQRHTRDIDELVVPSTIALRELALAEVPKIGERTPPLNDSFADAVTAFSEEASPPLCRGLLVEIADGIEASEAGFVEAVGDALLLPVDQIAGIVSALG